MTTNKAHILIADDAADYLSFLETFLKSKGFEVDTAREGLEAREKLALHSYDLLISDIQMPNFNGFELASYIKERKLNLPIIFISAAATFTTLEKGKEIGAITVLRKPVDVSMLIIAINKALVEKGKVIKRNERILIIDDNNEFEEVVSNFLEHAGYDVSTAIDGESGLKLAKDANPHFNIALVDENLPGMLGDAVIQKLKEISPETLPILISGEATKDEIGRAYKAGAFSYLSKPIDFTALLQCLISYEREAKIREADVNEQKRLANQPFYQKAYRWVKEYVDAPPNSPKNLQFRVVWISIAAILVGLITFWTIIKLEEYADETQAKVEKAEQLLEESNEYHRLKNEEKLMNEEREKAQREKFYRKMNEK